MIVGFSLEGNVVEFFFLWVGQERVALREGIRLGYAGGVGRYFEDVVVGAWLHVWGVTLGSECVAEG